MSLPEDAEDEYLDDLIQLIPSDVGTRADIEGYSYYKQKSYVPVSFFNNDRNLKLLSDCRPLRIELVDLKTVNKADDDDTEDESDDIRLEAISVEAKQILGKLSSSGLTIKHKNNIGKVESEKKDNTIDFKKNTGLIGLKVNQTFEVLEIDSESEESNISNETADKGNDNLDNVNKNNDNIKVDTVISVDADSVIADISREMTKLFEYDTNCNSGTASGKNNTSACCVDSSNGLTTDAPEITDEISKSLMISNSEDSQKQIKLKISSAKTSEKNEVVHISREINYVQENKTINNTHKKKEVIDNYSITSELKQDSKQNTRSGAITVENSHKTSHAVIAENISDIQGNNQRDNINGVASPVFPCTPQIKNKKSNNKTDDITSLVNNQPKDLNDHRFKPNKVKNLTNNSLKLSERVIDIEKTIDECILENLNTEFQSTKKIQKNLIENSCNKAQTINIVPPQSNKVYGTSVNTHRLSKICSKNEPRIEYLNAPCTTAVYQSQTSNNEKIIRIKLNEKIDKNTIEKEKSLKKIKDNRKVVNIDNIASKLHSHSAGCANQNDPKAFRKSGIIFNQNKQIFQQVCSAIVQDLDKLTPDSLEKRPQIIERDPNIVLKTKASTKKNNLVKINPYRWSSDPNQNNFSITSSIMNISPTKSTENKNTNATDANAMANGVNSNNITKSPIRDDTITGSNLNQKRHLESISENYKSNPAQNYLMGHQTHASFGPNRSKYVPPIMRNKGRQVLGIGRYTKDGYLHFMNNPNTIPAPYPGYSNYYNSYWPYLYTTLPPPPPPPPPPPVTVASSNNSAIAEPPLNNRVNVIKQINIKVRPAKELLQNNTDIKTKSDDTDTITNNTSPQNNSLTVVTSKSQMFEELEKEMMTIQEGALNCIINKDSRDYRITPHNNKEKRLDPRCHPGSNVSINTVPANEKSDSKNESSKCKVKQNTKAFKRPSDLTISKDSVKKKKNVMSKAGKDKGPVDATINSSQSYSAPILPIPSYTESLKILTQATNDMQEHIEKPCKKMDVDNSKITHDKDKVKKISLDEYKNREEKKQLSEKKKQKREKRKEKKAVKRDSETKNPDQDQGYDSDTTIIL